WPSWGRCRCGRRSTTRGTRCRRRAGCTAWPSGSGSATSASTPGTTTPRRPRRGCCARGRPPPRGEGGRRRMPLLDHFHPPLHPYHSWESFHSNWATRLADFLNERLPPEYIAEEHSHGGARLEVDVATYEQPDGGASAPRDGAPPVAVAPQAWAPPAAPYTMPAVFPDTFAVRVFSTASGLTLVAAIELVSPGNKDRADERRAFAAKCASYLYQGVSLIVVDIV